MNADSLSSSAFITSQTKEKWSGNVISDHRGKCEAWWINVMRYCLAPPFIFFCKPRRYRDNSISETGWKNDWIENGSVEKAILFLCFHFYIKGFKPLFGALSPSSSPWRRDRCYKPSQISAAPVSFGFAGHFAIGFQVFPVDLAQFWGGHFGGVWRGCPTT